MATKKKNLKQRIQMQNMIIIALAVIIVVLMGISTTAAWYIRTKSDSADIILSSPVNIYITEFEDKLKPDGSTSFEHKVIEKDILEGYRNRIYPGDRIKLKLGMQIGTAEEKSSTAYVRVKLSMAFSKISNDPNEPIIELEDMAGDGLIEYENAPDENIWHIMDFNDPTGTLAGTEGHVPDYWYVYKKVDPNTGKVSAASVEDLQTLEFINGYIKLSKTEVTNKHANCKFHIQYTVEAIQKANVPDPIAERGYGPWWSYALGDIEDLYPENYQ